MLWPCGGIGEGAARSGPVRRSASPAAEGERQGRRGERRRGDEDDGAAASGEERASSRRPCGRE